MNYISFTAVSPSRFDYFLTNSARFGSANYKCEKKGGFLAELLSPDYFEYLKNTLLILTYVNNLLTVLPPTSFGVCVCVCVCVCACVCVRVRAPVYIIYIYIYIYIYMCVCVCARLYIYIYNIYIYIYIYVCVCVCVCVSFLECKLLSAYNWKYF